MPEWNTFVRENLKNLRLSPRLQEEVAKEIAGHLEDLYGDLRQSGYNKSDAERLAIQQVRNWRKLARRIRGAKYEESAMNERTKTLWLPGMAAFAAASILLMFLQRLMTLRPWLLLALERIVPLRPTFWWKDQVDVIYLCWWILLPLCGAAGAYLSHRAGGTRLKCIGASLFPSIVMLCVFGFVLPVNVILEKNSFVMHHPLYFAIAFVNWTMVPGLALILGALPFIRRTADGPE